jgi:hypothetical protein
LDPAAVRVARETEESRHISVALITTEIVCKRCREHCPDIETAAENDWNI